MPLKNCRNHWHLGALCALAVAALGGCLGPGAVLSFQAPEASPAETITSKGPVASSPSTDEVQELKARIERLEHREKMSENQQAAPGSATNALNQGGVVDDNSGGKKGVRPLEFRGSDPFLSLTSPKLNAEWKNGLQFSTSDEAFRFHTGGRLQFDAGWNDASDRVMTGPGGIGSLEDGATFRRATLRLDGAMYKQISWLVEFDFANNVDNDNGPNVQPIGSPAFTEAWVAISDLPIVGNLRVGYMGEPLGLASQTSSRWLNFMERAPGVNSFTASSPGVMLFNWTQSERLTWAVGIFHPTDNNFGFGVGDGELAETGRLTWLPWYTDDGRCLVHLGVAATHRHPNQDQLEMRGRPSVRTQPGVLEPALADTGDLSVRSQEVVDVELAAVYGPWTFQSEYFATFLHDAAPLNTPPPAGFERSTLFYQGWYVEVLYFLTGEIRAYNRRDGVFDRVIPQRNFRVGGDGYGWGAWQVGVRYAYLDLQDKGVNGATLNDVTLGLNWFLNPNMKVQWNYALDHRNSTPPGSSGLTSIFGMRVALDF